EAEGVVAGTGHSAAHVIPLLMADIITTEFTLSPCFSDDEIYDVATTILDNWSEDVHVRRQTALDAIVEHRSPEPEPETTASGMKCIEPGQPSSAASHPLTYRRLLTIAALQGLCANPAYCHLRHDLPLMAIDLANDVIDMQEGGDAD
ncbi:exodeoxyribonuclease VIII, partial [Enterobacter ludwigii]